MLDFDFERALFGIIIAGIEKKAEAGEALTDSQREIKELLDAHRSTHGNQETQAHGRPAR